MIKKSLRDAAAASKARKQVNSTQLSSAQVSTSNTQLKKSDKFKVQTVAQKKRDKNRTAAEKQQRQVIKIAFKQDKLLSTFASFLIYDFTY